VCYSVARLWRIDGLCLLEMFAVLAVLGVPEAMRCVLLCMLRCGGWALIAGGVGDAAGDTLCATPYAGGCEG